MNPLRRRIRKTLLPLLFGMAVVAAMAWITASSPGIVPNTGFTTLTGERMDFKQWRGNPVLVIFWATTCPPCMRELPALIRLHHSYKSRGLKTVAISMPYDRPDRVVNTVRNFRIPFAVSLDPDGTLARDFGNIALTPTHILIAPDGRILVHQTGPLDLQTMQTRIESILQEEKS